MSLILPPAPSPAATVPLARYQSREPSRPAAAAVARRGSARALISLQAAFLALLAMISVWRGVWPAAPDTLLILAILTFCWRTRDRAFLLEFTPLFLVIFSFSVLRGYADDWSPAAVHFLGPIHCDQALFGGVVPPVVMAQWLQNSWTPFTLARFFTGVYLTHFIAPLALAAAIWHLERRYYWRYAFGFLAMTFSGFICYLLYPAAPPWMAAQQGYLPGAVGSAATMYIPSLLQRLNPNPVAAMPSLHAAFPTYTALFALWLWRERVRVLLVLPVAVCFATLFLGQHYVIDLIAGAGLGGSCALIATRWDSLKSLAARCRTHGGWNLEPSPGIPPTEIGD